VKSFWFQVSGFRLKRKKFLVSGFWFLVEEKRVSGSGTST
jgi:hypothetical protein